MIDEQDPEWQQDCREGSDALAKNDLTSRRKELPPLSHVLNAHDFEKAAEKVMDPAGWAYYCSASDDEVTLAENRAAFGRVWIRPRVMVDVSRVDASCRLLGAHSPLPLYITATAMGKLADPQGEVAINQACAEQGVIYMIPTLGSCSLEEIADSSAPGQTNWFQLYVNPDRRRTEQLVRSAEARGCKALFVTVDAPQLGRRERDMRFKAQQRPAQLQSAKDLTLDKGIATQLSAFIDPSLQWSDLEWLHSITTMPICLKGIQCGEDAVIAAKHGCKAIVLSNHGARQLDYARSALEVLPEVVAHLEAAGLRHKVEIYVDGGIRRGTDIFKAIALGANAVGIGRPAIYALAAYGKPGVAHLLHLLKEEFNSCLQLCGTPKLENIQSSLLVTSKL